MLSKNKIKYINSLQIKKFRQENAAFVVEGAKSVSELLTSDFEIELVALTDEYYKENTSRWDKQPFAVEIATANDLIKAGTLQTNDAALAVVKTKNNDFLCANAQELVLVLDDIRDPGNLGTIIRIADWYGITKIICSLTTTDWYNPKVIAASKGSFLRVRGFYTDLAKYFQKVGTNTVYGTFLNGEDVHSVSFAAGGYVVLGNESNGIGLETESFVNQRITIPRYGQAESLNVAIAAAIVLDVAVQSCKSANK
jgi:RNA methyltransferase, TrmH family